MLRELKNARQVPGEPRKRWFLSAGQDLVVWNDESGRVVAFQLCYGKDHDEHAVYWRADSGFCHLRVDDGQTNTIAPATPILVADGDCDTSAVLEQFEKNCSEVPPAISGFVRAKLREYGNLHTG